MLVKSYQGLTVSILRSINTKHQQIPVCLVSQGKRCFTTFHPQLWVCKCGQHRKLYLSQWVTVKTIFSVGKHSCMPLKGQSHALRCASPAVDSRFQETFWLCTGSIELTASANFTRQRIVSIGPRTCQSGWCTVNYVRPHLGLTFQYIASSTPPDYFIIIIFFLLKCKKIKLFHNSSVHWPSQSMKD